MYVIVYTYSTINSLLVLSIIMQIATLAFFERNTPLRDDEILKVISNISASSDIWSTITGISVLIKVAPATKVAMIGLEM